MTARAQRRRRRRRTALLAGAVVLGVVVTGRTVGLAEGGTDVQHCTTTRAVTVAAAPELAAVVADAAGRVPRTDDDAASTCVRLEVAATDPAEVHHAVTGQLSTRPDVWIPDSASWLDRAEAAGVSVPAERPAVATSPAVLALLRDASARLAPANRTASVADLLGPGARAARLALPERLDDAATAQTLAGLLTAVDGVPERTALASLLRRSLQVSSSDSDALLSAVVSGGATAASVTEQAVLTHNSVPGAAPLVAAYAPSGGLLDYPFAVLTHNARNQRAAHRLLTALRDETARRALAAAGFRDPAGVLPAGTTRDLGVEPGVRPMAVASDRAASAVRTVQVLTSGTRMLAVIDVSGSMARAVPGAGGATRLSLTKEAAGRGLSLYPDDAEIGLWVFSRHLQEGQDHRAVVPVGPLGMRADGRLGREVLTRALAGVREVPDGDTGLYDTALAAVRAVRSTWTADRINSVVLLTDGYNDDDGITLDALLTTLQREADPATPVPVITIGLGAESDRRALAAISRATGGSTYSAERADDVYGVFEDALGRRSCRPAC